MFGRYSNGLPCEGGASRARRAAAARIEVGSVRDCSARRIHSRGGKHRSRTHELLSVSTQLGEIRRRSTGQRGFEALVGSDPSDAL